MGYSFVRVTPLAAAIDHFLFLFHTVNIAIIVSVMSITKVTQPAMAPPTAAGTSTLLAALDTTSTLSSVVKLVTVVISQVEGMTLLSPHAEMTAIP